MTEILTGNELCERTDELLGQRRPDKESLRNWIRRGADRIDKLTKELQRVAPSTGPQGSEGALMMLEDARTAADTTLERVKAMEAEASAALEQACAQAEKASNDILGKTHSEAAHIIASARETARQHTTKTEAACANRMDQTIARADRVDQGCKQLVDQAKMLERSYRKRVSNIRAEAKAMVGLMERFDTLPITEHDDGLADEELLAEIVELKSSRSAIADDEPLGDAPTAQDASLGTNGTAAEIEEAG
jgi:hypothetical protein